MDDPESKTAPSLIASLGKIPSNVCIPDVVSYFYIKRIKGWMECPACGEKLFYDANNETWICKDCGFVLPEAEFLDGYVFWFCDECGVFLNNQKGFKPSLEKWTCTKCGSVNDITNANLMGICQECGELLVNPNGTVCEDCEQERLERMANQLEQAQEEINTRKDEQ